MIIRFANLLFLLAIFFLSWQTQWILTQATVAGEPSTYGVFSFYVVEVMIICAFLLRGRQQTNWRVRKTWRALYFFLAAAFFSLGFSQIEGVGWFHMIHVFSAALLYFLITDERTDIKQVLWIFLLGLLLPIILGWFQVLNGSSPDSTLLGIAAKDVNTLGVAVVETQSGRLLRAYGTFPHPNIFGGFIAFGILALAWLSRFLQQRKSCVAAVLASLFLGATLVVTFSRSAWLGVCIGLLVLMSFMLWQKKLPPRRALPVMVVGLASIFATLLIFYPQVISRFDSSLRLESISLEERAYQYQTFGQVFSSAPFFGVGPNAYTFTLARLDPGRPVWSYQPIHNSFLLIFAELGIVGIVLFGYWMFILNPTTIRKPHGMFAVALAATFFIIALFDHYLWSLWPGLALSAMALGVIVKWSSTSSGHVVTI